MRRIFLLAIALCATGGWFGATPAAAQDYATCNGVQVIIDYGSLGGGVRSSCATSFGTGTAALRSAGFSPTLDNGFVTKITAKPTISNIYQAYWSYWHATRNSDGSYSGWSYSNLGANSYHPTKGNAEGWHYISLSDSASGPSEKPANNAAVTASTKRSSHTASTQTKTTATSSASSASATATSTTGSNTGTSTAGSTSVSATADASTATASAATATATDSASPETATDSGTETGTPVALIATGAATAVSGVGAGAWWLLKGRRH
jgi:hypothetical protein